MPYSVEGKLVVAISSRALFDFEEENRIFDAEGERAYIDLQFSRLNVPAKAGVAFPLVKKLLAFNTGEAQRVEVVILSKNDPVSGLRIFRSAERAGLRIERGVFTRGRSPYRYLDALRANLFRTLLTLLGVVIGVAAVVVMLAIGNGSQQQVLDRISAMGTNLLIVRPGAGISEGSALQVFAWALIRSLGSRGGPSCTTPMLSKMPATVNRIHPDMAMMRMASVIATVIAMLPSKDNRWTAAYVLIAAGIPILGWVTYETGPFWGLLSLAAGASILRWPLICTWRWLRRGGKREGKAAE